jgi:hypothetical protein
LDGRVTAFHVPGAGRRDYALRDTQVDRTIGSPATTIDFVVCLPDRDLVAEKPRHACSGVRDQRLIGVEFQLEVITQELGQPLFDLFGLGLRSGEPE